MIKHIVMWKLEDVAQGSTRTENALQIKQMLEALPEKIDGILKLEVGIDTNPKNYDVVLYSEFVSPEALAAYDVHPAHVKCKDFIKKVIVERVACDYEAE
ncbi:MAG: Dabb family protein [Ruminococcaceae bacterium]|nr:Dabb family protein [Oscillospiraceae bacterium]